MTVETIEVLSDENAAILIRQARWQRQKDRHYFKRMTAADVVDQLQASISAWLVAVTQKISTVESPLPPMSEDQLRPSETPEVIALLMYARAYPGRFLLVEFTSKPPQTFQKGLRAAARVRNLAVHLETLIGASMLLKVNPKGTPEESAKMEESL
jgi:hypothetical protein